MVTGMATPAVPATVLEAWGLADASLEPISVGLINRTLVATHGETRLVLQRLHPVFAATVNLDIAAVTAHLAGKGVLTPRIVPTDTGALWHEAEDGVWRALTWIPGRVVATPTGPAMAHAAGALVARFHRAVADLEHAFHFTRPGAHDTARHLAHLAEVVRTHTRHDLFEAVRPVAERILAQGATLPPIPALPTRIIHGDLKLTNIVFDDALTEAVALVDLDTLAHGTIAVELGDALRSWCNPGGESDPTARVDVTVFAAAVQGYAAEAPDLLTSAEAAAIAAGTETITLELAARFCADALEETYFGWDATRFARRGEHDRVRALSQLCLTESIRDCREELAQLVAEAFGAR
jgi:Ser/Thr protein kinase RdoA (MazF antagonist)